MLLSGSGALDSYVQFMTVLIIFLFVLLITYFVTKWTAGYQKGKASNVNMEIMDTIQISPNKFVQIIRIGRKYLAVAICKDTVTMLTEIPEQDLIFSEKNVSGTLSFRDVLEKMQKKNLIDKEDGRDE